MNEVQVQFNRLVEQYAEKRRRGGWPSWEELDALAAAKRAATPPPTWRDRLRWRVARVRSYVLTVVRALRGDQPCDTGSNW